MFQAKYCQVRRSYMGHHDIPEASICTRTFSAPVPIHISTYANFQSVTKHQHGTGSRSSLPKNFETSKDGKQNFRKK